MNGCGINLDQTSVVIDTPNGFNPRTVWNKVFEPAATTTRCEVYNTVFVVHFASSNRVGTLVEVDVPVKNHIDIIFLDNR